MTQCSSFRRPSAMTGIHCATNVASTSTRIASTSLRFFLVILLVANGPCTGQAQRTMRCPRASSRNVVSSAELAGCRFSSISMMILSALSAANSSFQ